MIRQHSSTVQKHPKHGSGAMSIQGKSFKTIHENHDNQVCENMTSVARLFVRAMKTSVQNEMSDSQTDVDEGQEDEDPDDCGA